MDLYEADFHAWALRQAALLRDPGRRGQADFDRVAAELECLAREELRVVERGLVSAFIGLIRGAGGLGPEGRRRTEREVLTALLDASDGFTPSMRGRLDLGELWGRARNRSRREAELDGQAWADPGETCPFTLDQLLAEDVEVGQLLAAHILTNVVPDVDPAEGDELR
jgi:hypothetical protein